MSSSDDGDRLLDAHIIGNDRNVRRAIATIALMPPAGRTLPSPFLVAAEVAAAASLEDDDNGKQLK